MEPRRKIPPCEKIRVGKMTTIVWCGCEKYHRPWLQESWWLPMRRNKKRKRLQNPNQTPEKMTTMVTRVMPKMTILPKMKKRMGKMVRREMTKIMMITAMRTRGMIIRMKIMTTNKRTKMTQRRKRRKKKNPTMRKRRKRKQHQRKHPPHRRPQKLKPLLRRVCPAFGNNLKRPTANPSCPIPAFRPVNPPFWSNPQPWRWRKKKKLLTNQTRKTKPTSPIRQNRRRMPKIIRKMERLPSRMVPWWQELLPWERVRGPWEPP
mmetsp:Transcript_4699/g.10023  ORF Transcript_4699/g.10023 Transcript_4699/m.10023 type:complete len:262 (+) Transcript_4699:432-1217(+)